MKLLLSLFFLSFLGLPAEAQNKRTYRYSKTPKIKKKQLKKRHNRSKSNFQIKRQPKPNKTLRKTLKPKKPKQPLLKKKRCGKRCIEFKVMKRLWLEDILRQDPVRRLRMHRRRTKRSR